MSTKRLSGKRVASVFVLLLAAGVAVLIARFFHDETPTGPILATTPVGDGTSLTLRGAAGSKNFVILSRERADGSFAWHDTLFGAVSGAKPLAVDGLAVVRAHTSRGLPETQAYRLNDGALAWRAGRPDEGAHLSGRGPDVVHGGKLYAFYEGSPGWLIVLALVDGHELSRQPIEKASGPLTAQTTPQGIMVSSPSGPVLRVRFGDAKGAATAADAPAR